MVKVCVFGSLAQRVIPEQTLSLRLEKSTITTERAVGSKKKKDSTLLFENKRRKSEQTKALTLPSMMCNTPFLWPFSERLMKRLEREALTRLILFVIMNGDVSVWRSSGLFYIYCVTLHNNSLHYFVCHDTLCNTV